MRVGHSRRSQVWASESASLSKQEAKDNEEHPMKNSHVVTTGPASAKTIKCDSQNMTQQKGNDNSHWGYFWSAVAIFPTEALMNALGKWREMNEASMLGRLTTRSRNDVHPSSSPLPATTCGRMVHLAPRQVTAQWLSFLAPLPAASQELLIKMRGFYVVHLCPSSNRELCVPLWVAPSLEKFKVLGKTSQPQLTSNCFH